MAAAASELHGAEQIKKDCWPGAGERVGMGEAGGCWRGRAGALGCQADEQKESYSVLK